MTNYLISLCLLGSLLHASTLCKIPATEFHLKGDYIIGGLFNIHQTSSSVYHGIPEAIDCSSQSFILSNYQKFQWMRFSVEEINNSTNLLPNVSLGYDIFDHCSDVHSFPDILNLISVNGLIQPFEKSTNKLPKAIAVIGPFSSTDTLTAAPFFMVDLIPLVSYGASSSVFSEKPRFPSFLRTVHPSKDVIEVIVNIVLHFKWSWVAFVNSDNDFGIDGRDSFMKRIKDTEICLAYTKNVNDNTNYVHMFKQIESQGINVIIIFTPESTVDALMDSAINLNVTNKVWIAGDTWSLNKQLQKKKGIKNIGTILGVSQPLVKIPGFDHFIYSAKSQIHCDNTAQPKFCCSFLNTEDILTVDSSFSFHVYTAVYAIAHALHNTLKCGNGRCDSNITISPHMILTELQKSNFTLLNRKIQFDEYGDPRFGSYSLVFWNSTGDAEEIGFYKYQSDDFFINNSKIQWHMNETVPTSFCSPECPKGFVKKQDGIHKCCFICEICLNGTYVNSTEDPYNCLPCKDTEWSEPGSTSCSLRAVEYIPFTDSGAILIMVGAWVFVGLTLATSVVFVINYNTPVVRSAGGPMCFLILGCLTLCTISVFFYFDKPTMSFCVLRFIPFVLFYTVCLACFVVRSFQIVCIFKIAAKFPKLYIWWMKYHGQWLVITVTFVTQAILLLINYFNHPPNPYNDTFWYPDKIVLNCDIDFCGILMAAVLLVTLCSLCFIFSYMGKDLPKNYNEAKAITFCLFLLTLTWIVSSTVFMLYRGKYILILNALAILFSIYSFLFSYFLPKCYIIIFQSHKNTQQYFQGLIQNYTKTISQ
ncbi:taste receptor type 1 member 1-like [Antennarius striatus]|uniref:taste receptor type 1 member 1-like n=1 Tax=Antennarius striatus TaxID=241820 RepID=UPI0035B41AFA